MIIVNVSIGRFARVGGTLAIGLFLGALGFLLYDSLTQSAAYAAPRTALSQPPAPGAWQPADVMKQIGLSPSGLPAGGDWTANPVPGLTAPAASAPVASAPAPVDPAPAAPFAATDAPATGATGSLCPRPWMLTCPEGNGGPPDVSAPVAPAPGTGWPADAGIGPVVPPGPGVGGGTPPTPPGPNPPPPAPGGGQPPSGTSPGGGPWPAIPPIVPPPVDLTNVPLGWSPLTTNPNVINTVAKLLDFISQTPAPPSATPQGIVGTALTVTDYLTQWAQDRVPGTVSQQDLEQALRAAQQARTKVANAQSSLNSPAAEDNPYFKAKALGRQIKAMKSLEKASNRADAIRQKLKGRGPKGPGGKGPRGGTGGPSPQRRPKGPKGPQPAPSGTAAGPATNAAPQPAPGTNPGTATSPITNENRLGEGSHPAVAPPDTAGVPAQPAPAGTVPAPGTATVPDLPPATDQSPAAPDTTPAPVPVIPGNVNNPGLLGVDPQPRGRVLHVFPDGKMEIVGPDGQPMVVGPDGQPVPPAPSAPGQGACACGEQAPNPWVGIVPPAGGPVPEVPMEPVPGGILIPGLISAPAPSPGGSTPVPPRDHRGTGNGSSLDPDRGGTPPPRDGSSVNPDRGGTPPPRDGDTGGNRLGEGSHPGSPGTDGGNSTGGGSSPGAGTSPGGPPGGATQGGNGSGGDSAGGGGSGTGGGGGDSSAPGPDAPSAPAPGPENKPAQDHSNDDPAKRV